MKAYVFDAGALMLMLLGDERLRSYIEEISEGLARAYLSAVNLAELYYKTVEKIGRETAETWYFRILNSNVVVVPADDKYAREAGIYKSRYGGALSLADCFAMALCAREKALLLTTDSDFNEVREVDIKYFPVY
ncbi:MAG: type II toxin-antitoxin system VapC family toxin [Candidatus Bathyarchaeia archaeon]